MKKRKEFITYCYDKEFIQNWKKLETEYATEPDSSSDNMVDMLVDKFGDNCIPISIHVCDDCIETRFKLNRKGEII